MRAMHRAAPVLVLRRVRLRYFQRCLGLVFACKIGRTASKCGVSTVNAPAYLEGEEVGRLVYC